ncbi:DUF1415 domain-containing protein [Noviherbaspirillum sp. ST9]|uniref:DUF1415 domain-containing protein n=1 Tax=Noviherbaspirillum sp. ST9 TaxID=3401606 RepID=UPI003B586356
MHTPPPHDDVIAATRRWLEKAVIGLNLCPFAKSVYIKEQVRFFVSSADSTEALQADLAAELLKLKETDAAKVDTVLLIHPYVLTDFLDFNDFLDVVDATLETLGLEGEIQVASFHPQYQFADAGPDDISNYTNRAPYPTLHLLREASIDRAVDAFPDASDIFERNIETVQRMGKTAWDELLSDGAPDCAINGTKQN